MTPFETFEEMLTKADARYGITHLDGVRWADAPIPKRRHTCWAQTTSSYHHIERCACGAIHFTDDPVFVYRGRKIWSERNSRNRPPRRFRFWKRGRR